MPIYKWPVNKYKKDNQNTSKPVLLTLIYKIKLNKCPKTTNQQELLASRMKAVAAATVAAAITVTVAAAAAAVVVVVAVKVDVVVLLREKIKKHPGRNGACWWEKIILVGKDHMLVGKDHVVCGR